MRVKGQSVEDMIEHANACTASNGPLKVGAVYFKMLGKEVEAKTFDPYCTYYCKDAGGNEWTIKGEVQRWPGYERQCWTARFKGNIVSSNSVSSCAELVSTQAAPPPAQIQVRVTCDTGKTWVTTINGDLAEAKQYFMDGFILTDEEHPYTGIQTQHRVIGVVQV